MAAPRHRNRLVLRGRRRCFGRGLAWSPVRLPLVQKPLQILFGVLVVLKPDQVIEIVGGECWLDLRLTFGILLWIDPVAEMRGVEAQTDEEFRAWRCQPEVAFEKWITATGGYRLPEILFRNDRFVLSRRLFHAPHYSICRRGRTKSN